MLLYLLPGSFAAAFGLVALINFFLLWGWRRSAGAHWTERARILYPARITARWNLWLIPLLLFGVQMILWPNLHEGLLGFVAAILGAASGSWFLTKETLPTARFRIWLRDLIIGMSRGALRSGLYLTIAFSMPSRLNGHAFLLMGVAIAYDLFLVTGGLQRLFRTTGIIYDAPERVQKLAAEVCARMQAPVPKLWVAASCVTNAYALFWTRAILLTEPALGLLTDAQLKGILAHEMAHLTESLGVRLLRIGGLLALWPVLLFKPLIGMYGGAAMLAIGVWALVVRRQMRRLSRRMEHRADHSAVAQSPAESASYAAALAKLYEVNSLPAVMPASERRTHPDLYDRLLTAGVTPDFPRPAAPDRFQPLTPFLCFFALALAAPILLKLVDELTDERTTKKAPPASLRRE